MHASAITTPQPRLDAMRREAKSHAARIAAIARERLGAAPILDREAHRRQTARRLAAESGTLAEGGTLSGS